MSSKAGQLDQNEELARAINQDARHNPSSPYRGKFVGIARGKVVAVADSLAELLPELRKAEPDRLQRMFLEASADYDGPHDIWWIF